MFCFSFATILLFFRRMHQIALPIFWVSDNFPLQIPSLWGKGGRFFRGCLLPSKGALGQSSLKSGRLLAKDRPLLLPFVACCQQLTPALGTGYSCPFCAGGGRRSRHRRLQPRARRESRRALGLCGATALCIYPADPQAVLRRDAETAPSSAGY